MRDGPWRGLFDACFFAIGVTPSGLDEDAYSRLTLAIATPLARLNPGMIQPLHGAQSKTASYQILDRLLAPVLSLLSLLPITR